MITNVTLRAWQTRFKRTLRAHRGVDFLLVACPAAGKTIGAGAAIADVMADRDCDQLVVVCPTVVVRDQWQLVLAELGYRMGTDFGEAGWPDWQHGVCGTYAQVALRADRYREMVERRRTAVIFDEIHHAGEQRVWGDALEEAFELAVLRLLVSGTPFRSDRERIPFVPYDVEGNCAPDFAYDYPQAVRDGVCRKVEFRAHDGIISWQGRAGKFGDDELSEPVSARFSDRVPLWQRGPRLRASLDPTQSYLRSLLEAAHADLLSLRERVPDAAGLVVCDDQAHALAIDELMVEVTGQVPVLAISDMPRAHQAIRSFAGETGEWLVSVRMVSEGVDIPRLGVIAWATCAKTELMVRQVAGRALRAQGAHAELPAIVHIPGDAILMKYARRLHVLGGAVPRYSRKQDHKQAGRDKTPKGGHKSRNVDPGPLVEWFERQVKFQDQDRVLARMGLDYDAGSRLLYRWREEGGWVDPLTLYDICHMADLDFDTLFAGPEYAQARAYVYGDGQAVGAESRLSALSARAFGTPETVAPPLPTGARPHTVDEPEQIVTPELPPSPADVEAAELVHRESRGEVFRLLSVYARLRAVVTPGYHAMSAHTELAAAVGKVTADSPDEHVAEALEWLRCRTAEFAAAHPDAVRQVARAHRRLSLAS